MKTNKINVVLSLNKTVVNKYDSNRISGKAPNTLTTGQESEVICLPSKSDWVCGCDPVAKTRTFGQTL